MEDRATFIGALFDFSFSNFVVLRLVKFIYALAILALAIGMVVIIVTGLTQGGAEGLGAMLLAPLGAVLYLLLIRMWLELVVVIFRIGETATEIRDSLRDQTRGGTAGF